MQSSEECAVLAVENVENAWRMACIYLSPGLSRKDYDSKRVSNAWNTVLECASASPHLPSMARGKNENELQDVTATRKASTARMKRDTR